MLSLPASKGFDIGSGFGGIFLTGTHHNDPFRAKGGKVYTTANRSGGIQGGISNGETIYFRVAFKPVATVMQEQDTVDIKYLSYRDELIIADFLHNATLNDLLDIHEAAAALGNLNVYSVYRLIWEGRLPVVRKGRSVRIRLSAITRYRATTKRSRAVKRRGSLWLKG